MTGGNTRAALLSGLPYVPVKVLWSGTWTTDVRFEDFVTPSHFKSPRWRQRLHEQAEALGHDWQLIRKHTDPSDRMEGVYVKWEDGGILFTGDARREAGARRSRSACDRVSALS